MDEAQAQHPTLQQELVELRANEDSGGYCELDFISLKGRLGRLRYLVWFMTMTLLLIPVVMVGSFLVPKFEPQVIFGGVVVWIAFRFTLRFRRLHDINMSAWWMLLFLVPLISNLFGLYLLLKSGADGNNDYGPPPPPNNNNIAVFVGGSLLLAALTFAAVFSVLTFAH
ncbi:MAG: DUF805 domain-containing protein [Zoogloeaceae bacterium]|jgi:uncharacterized membrane protein YhaH (DUF805 family)|nr:DUF805 domain-containing protein [Zoogloeaceae bacterium]